MRWLRSLALATVSCAALELPPCGQRESGAHHAQYLQGGPPAQRRRWESFALCCQLQLPASAGAEELCGGGGGWDCPGASKCQEEALAAGSSFGQAADTSVLEGTRGTARLPEMQLYFQLQILPYLTFGDNGEALAADPVFLDIEHVLPSLLLALAAEALAAEPSAQLQRFGPLVVDVGAFEGAVSFACLALWDAILATAPHWPSVALPPGGVAPRSPRTARAMRVVAVEADPDRCGALQGFSKPLLGESYVNRSALRKLVDGRITAICAAALAYEGASMLRCPQGSHCYVSDEEIAELKSASEPESVEVVTVDALVEQHGHREVALLKVDAEGADLEVLRGARRLLAEGRVRFVVFEVSLLWEHRRSAQTGARMQNHHAQLLEALEFLEATGGYMCFLLGPEMLIPLTMPWLISRYIYTSHQFNVLCAPREDPVLHVVIRLYTVVPRAAQFSLAALPPALGVQPECWACRDIAMNDPTLRRDASLVERYFATVYLRAVAQGWDLPHFRFMRARWLQASGQVSEAHKAYAALAAECCHEPSTFQASRERFQLASGVVRFVAAKMVPFLLHNATARRAARGPARRAAENAIQLAWLQLRPGSGAAFGEVASCSARAWLLLAARLGHETGAFFAGLAAHFGECSGQMTMAGLREAKVWYDRATFFQKQGGELGSWATFAAEASAVVASIVA